MSVRRVEPVVCDVGGLPASLVTLDRLARLQLVAQRTGHQLLLRDASRELVELARLAGLVEALRLETRRQPEEREERGRVEEEGQLPDPPA
jgi:hypothetical protein